ncbi:Type II secretory pathway, component PulF [Oleispira antarctica RB-8]|uniref:Type II secretory pathway, component PulF n=1 Tax=Oleispira antarctica RB-8 TaxID=698738 RepID=R4YK51_OLEAN|nr:Type II secretory pathway, component PulF [Oleispira antarctica RB-8]
MPDFEYTGRDSAGQQISGQLEASSQAAAMSQLQLKKIILTSLAEKTLESKGVEFSFTIKRKIALDDQVLLTRQLYALTKAGIPIIRALNGLAESSDNARLSEVLNAIATSLISGTELATAFRQFPKIFSPIFISMIHVGENTGRLDLAFQKLTAHLELERETKKRIKSATRYPIFVILAITMAMTVINVMVIPSFASVFAKLGADLPIATRILMASSEFTINYWWLILLVLGSGSFAWVRFVKTPEGLLWWDTKKLRLPLFGSLFKRIALSRFSRSFAMMLTSGVPILKALSIVAESVGNRSIGLAIEEMYRGVERGERLTSTAAATGLFTPLVLQMMAVGEETGSVDTLLNDVADFYEEEIDYELKQLADSIEPILLVFLGILVLVLALGVFLPIWDLSGAMGGK